MSGFLVFVGFLLLIAGTIAVIRGSLPAVGIRTRKAAGMILAAAFVALLAGGVAGSSPTDSPDPSSESEARPEPTEGAPVLVPPTAPQPPAAPQPPVPPPAPARPAGIPAEAQEATVVRHVDGDTFWAEGGTLPPGTASSVRLLEVDTPESTTQTQCYGPDAAAFTRSELPVGSKVYLLADRGDTDRFGRFLRYVWKANGEFYNEKLALQGYARAVLVAPNDRYIGAMREAESEARAARRGLWSACAAPAPPPPQPPAPRAPAPAPAPPAGGGCHPSYPDFCVAPPPPDLDCADIGRQLTVRQPDPHRFDGQPGQVGEPDGVGCESYP